LARPKADIEQVVEELDYNFEEFELDHFVKYVQTARGRLLVVLPYPFASTLFGLWIPGEITDYVFYSSRTHPIHQAHIVLHEIGHMLLKHRLRPLKDILPPELWVEFQQVGLQGHVRSALSASSYNDEEQECELFVSYLQRSIVEKNRLNELIGVSSSMPVLREYTDAMSDIEGAF
jgi:hypothetical protein